MTSDSLNFTCELCDYKSKWKCNLSRHVVRKHSAPNVHFSAPNVHVPAPNVHVLAPNVHVPAPNVHFFKNENICEEISDHTSNETNKCEKCNKTFSRKNILLKHYDNCKGLYNKLSCEYCNNTYATRSSKSNHLRVCKVKKNIDSCALVVQTPQLQQSQQSQQTPQSQQTQHSQHSQDSQQSPSDTSHQSCIQNITNNTTNINNGTINNIVQNIIVYDPKNMELLNDHISKSELKSMLHASDRDFPRVLTDYSKALMRRTENQCVRKTNLRSASSAVHVGNNKWEYQSDNEVLPKLLSHIATNLGNIQHDYKIKIMQELDTFILDVQAEAIDCHEDSKEEERLKELFKRTLTNVKHLLFNLTKQTLAKKIKQQ